MSEWDDLNPDEKRRRLLEDPAEAKRLIAADKALIAAMNRNPIDLEGLRAALKDDASPDRIVINGMPALHVAVHKRDTKALDLLLNHGARTDDWDVDGANALDEAYRKRFQEGIRLLKQFGAETRQVVPLGDDKPEDVLTSSCEQRANTYLIRMIRFGTAEQVRDAIALGANVNPPRPETGGFWPPLHIAAAQCEPEKVKILVEAGADLFARSSRGQEVTDVMWETPGAKLLGPEWVQVFEYLHDKGYQNFFVKHPSEFRLEDLRQTLPTGEKDAPTTMHHLVFTGHADVLFDVLKKHPQDVMTAGDFLKRSEKHRRTFLEACGDAGRIKDVFTADIWQGRLEEMLSLRETVERNLFLRRTVDFNKAAADVRARRLHELRLKAPKLQLRKEPKHGPPNP